MGRDFMFREKIGKWNQNMFDEKNGKWIKIYKKITVVLFWLFVALGVFAFFDNWLGGEFFNSNYFGYFLDGILLLAVFICVGYVQLVSNMLIIQFLNNVQIIREKIEKNEE